MTCWDWVGRWGLALVVAVLAGCITLPGQVSRQAFVTRVVDREYAMVWEALQAALRDEGAIALTADHQRGAIETAYRIRPGSKVLARSLLGYEETRNPLIEVRYSVRTRPLGPEKTEVRLRTEIQYLDRLAGWVRAAEDGSLADAFWRRLDRDLAFYVARPETLRTNEGGRESSPPQPEPLQGRDATEAEPR